MGALTRDADFILSYGGEIGLPRPPVAQVDTAGPTIWAVLDLGERVVRIAKLQTGELGHQEMESVRNPFFPGQTAAVGDDPPAVHISGPGVAEIRSYTLDGELERIARAGIPRAELTSEMIETERSALLAAAEAADRDVESRRASFEALTFPDSVPAIAGVYSGGRGVLWTRRWSHPRDTAAPLVFDVFDPEGRWLGPVEAPASVLRSSLPRESVAYAPHRLVAQKRRTTGPHFPRHLERLDNEDGCPLWPESCRKVAAWRRAPRRSPPPWCPDPSSRRETMASREADTWVPPSGGTRIDQGSVAERVRSYVAQNFLFRDELDLPAGASLLDAGILDSLGVMELVAFLEEEFCLTLEDRELVRDNLDTVAGISALVKRHLDAT